MLVNNMYVSDCKIVFGLPLWLRYLHLLLAHTYLKDNTESNIDYILASQKLNAIWLH